MSSARGRRRYAPHGARRDAVDRELAREATRDASEGAMAAAKLWGGQAAEIEILEISAGVRMGK